MTQLVHIAGCPQYRAAMLETEDGKAKLEQLTKYCDEHDLDLDCALHVMPDGRCTDSDINHIQIVGGSKLHIMRSTFTGDDLVVETFEQEAYRYNGELYTPNVGA